MLGCGFRRVFSRITGKSQTFRHLVGIAPKFGKGPHRGSRFQIKAPMSAVDSSSVRLTTDSID